MDAEELQDILQHSPIHQYIRDSAGEIVWNSRHSTPLSAQLPLSEHESKDQIHHLQDPQGHDRWIQVTTQAITDNNGNPAGTLNSEIDVTEQVQREEALRSDQRLLNSILKNIPDRIFFKDLESRFIRVSNEVVNVIGVKSEDDLLGKTDADFFIEEDARKLLMDELAVITTGKGLIEIEEKGMFKDGRSFWLSTTKVPLYDEAGTIIGTMGISRNITRLKELEIQHIQIIKDLESALTQVKQLSGMVPICSYCKSIRNDEGYWNTIEDYIHENSEAEFSHGICDSCLGKHFPDVKGEEP